jgi:hypothetical protein
MSGDTNSLNSRTNGSRKRKSTPLDNTAIPSLKSHYGGSGSSWGGPTAGRQTTTKERGRSQRQAPMGLALARERQYMDGVLASPARLKTEATKGLDIVTAASKWATSKIKDAFNGLSPPTTTTTRANGISYINALASRPPTRSGRHQQPEDERERNHRRRKAEGQEEVVVDQQIDNHRSHPQVAHVNLCDSDDDTVDDTKETKKQHSPKMTPADSGRREYDVPLSRSTRHHQGAASANQLDSSHSADGSAFSHNAVSSPGIPRKKQEQVDGQFVSNLGQLPQLEDQRFPRTGSSNDEPQRASQSALMLNSESPWNDDSEDRAQRKRPISPAVNGQHPLRQRTTYRNESLDNAGKAATHSSPQYSTSTCSSLKEDDESQDLASLASSPVPTSARANSKSFGKLNNVLDLSSSCEHEESTVSSSMAARRCVERISEDQRLVVPSRRGLPSSSSFALGLSKQNGTQKSKSFVYYFTFSVG